MKSRWLDGRPASARTVLPTSSCCTATNIAAPLISRRLHFWSRRPVSVTTAQGQRDSGRHALSPQGSTQRKGRVARPTASSHVTAIQTAAAAIQVAAGHLSARRTPARQVTASSASAGQVIDSTAAVGQVVAGTSRRDRDTSQLSQLVETAAGPLRIRPVAPADIVQVVQLHTECFYQRQALAFLDPLARSVFRSEVLEATKLKLCNSNPADFVMLVAEALSPEDAEAFKQEEAEGAMSRAAEAEAEAGRSVEGRDSGRDVTRSDGADAASTNNGSSSGGNDSSSSDGSRSSSSEIISSNDNNNGTSTSSAEIPAGSGSSSSGGSTSSSMTESSAAASEGLRNIQAFSVSPNSSSGSGSGSSSSTPGSTSTEADVAARTAAYVVRAAERATQPLASGSPRWALHFRQTDWQAATAPTAGGGGAAVAAVAPRRIVGVVEVSIQRQADVVAALRERRRLAGPSEANTPIQQYAYISSMAVAPAARRRGVATALVRAGEAYAVRQWFRYGGYIALNVDEDNAEAVRLYRRYGMEETARDPEWRKWLGGRGRLVLAKSLEGATGDAAETADVAAAVATVAS